jgi:hypothetical protein
VETREEKPDWNDWPSIVRWAARLPPDSQAARAIARGAPVGPPLGVDVSPDDVRRGPRVPLRGDQLLTVVSGYFDDRRQMLGPGHELYAVATYAYAYRDFWTDGEHRDYWRAHLHVWPAREGRRGNRESLAFAIVQARVVGQPLDETLASLAATRDDLRDRNVLDLAEKMHTELENGPSDLRLPRVVTDQELDHMPLLTGFQNLDAAEGAANVKVGASARDVVLRAAASAARWASANPQRQ